MKQKIYWKFQYEMCKAKAYFEEKEGTSIPGFRLSIKNEKLLKEFIIRGGFDINENENK